MREFPPKGEWWRIAARRVWLLTADEMAELDRHATTSDTIPERALIENAGREVAHRVQTRWPEGPVVALAGSGHNGADALVALRTLGAWGREIRAVQCGSRRPEPDVLRGWDLPWGGPDDLGGALTGAAVALDGILGTGITEAPRTPQAQIITEVNGSGIAVVAVDGPSGADFTTGHTPGECIRAELTVTFGWPKLGLLYGPARERCGDLLAVEIGFPPPPEPPGARAITARWVRDEMLALRGASAHKGRAGYLTLIAGQLGMGGASVLAARSAVRGGAGIVRVVGHPGNREIVQTAAPETVFVPWDDPVGLAESIEWADAIAIGPGLGQGASQTALVETVLDARDTRPIVMDADALNAWAGRASELAGRLTAPALLTPHPGELSRLLGPIEEILADPPAAARAAALELSATVVLKGAPTIVAEEGEALRVSTIATPALAAGGTGDVLTGLAGAYLAAGMTPADAASAALMITGIAAAAAPGAVGHSSADLPDSIPEARAALVAADDAAVPGVLFAAPAASGPDGRV